MWYPEMGDDIREVFAEAQARADISSRIEGPYTKVLLTEAGEHVAKKDQKLGFNQRLPPKKIRIRKANGRPPKPVEDDEGTRYPSIAAAAAHLGIHPTLIVNVLKGRKLTTHGRSFRYVS